MATSRTFKPLGQPRPFLEQFSDLRKLVETLRLRVEVLEQQQPARALKPSPATKGGQ